MVLETREIGGADQEEEQELGNREPRDLKPEYCHYRDEGCEYAGSCLECPFPQCIYDEPRGRQRWLKKARDKKIRKLYGNGKKVKELAELFGVSQRTIQRALGSG
jgi:hypothetical protein